MERLRTILEIGSHADGPIKSADEVEALLIEEIRRLGNTTMRDVIKEKFESPASYSKASGSMR